MTTSGSVTATPASGSGDVAPEFGSDGSTQVSSLEVPPRLRDTQFPLMWLNAFSFMLISTAERFTFVWLVIETLEGPSWASGATLFALGLPVFLLVLPAGALADRYDRRKLLMITQLAGAAVTGLSALLVWAELMTVPLALLPALLLGSAMAFGMPIRSSLIPAIVPQSLLMRAIVTNTIGMNVAMIIGPVLGGIVIRQSGVAAAFGIEAALFGLGFLALLPLRVPAHLASASAQPFSVSSLLASIREGLAFVWRNDALRGLFTLLAVGGFVMMGSSSLLLPQIAKDEFGRAADEASRLFAFMGVGMTITSLFLMAKRGVTRKGLVFLISMVSGTFCQTLQGVAPSYRVLAALLLWWGLSGGFYLNLNQTLIQSATPPEKMGRVMSLSVLANAGLAPLGSLVAGALASTSLGPQHTHGLFGAVGLLCVLLVFVRSKALRTVQ